MSHPFVRSKWQPGKVDGVWQRMMTVPDYRADVLRWFVIFAVSSSLLTMAALYAVKQQEKSRRLAELQIFERGIANRQATLVRDNLMLLRADSLFLRDQYQDLLGYHRDDPEEARRQATQTFFNFIATRDVYDQVRLIDNDGNEVIRINYNGGAPIRVSDDRLRNKSARDYVQRALHGPSSDVAISLIDLNVEDGAVVLPIKPTIRVASPVFGPDGERAGIIVLNFLADRLLTEVEAASDLGTGHPITLNAEGYFLVPYGAVPVWGFMLPTDEPDQFGEIYPVTWNAITGTTEGQILNEEGLFTYLVIDPFSDVLLGTRGFQGFLPPRHRAAISDAQRVWYVGTFVPADELKAAVDDPSSALFVYRALILLLCLIGSAVSAVTISSARDHRRMLERLARFDTLTGLLNRSALEDRLDEEIARASRRGNVMAIAFLDIDGFKSINDDLGHAVGDRALVDIARAIETQVREHDFFAYSPAASGARPAPFSARIGGDEFVVALPDLQSLQDAQPIMLRIATAIRELAWGDHRVDVSIGLAMFPRHGRTRRDLLHAADYAMYAAKRSAAGGIVIAQDAEGPAEPGTPNRLTR